MAQIIDPNVIGTGIGSTNRPTNTDDSVAFKYLSSVYTEFDQNRDIVKNSKKTVTEGIFASGAGTITDYMTSSAQVALSSSRYYMHVYDSEDSGSVVFDISYGNYNGYVSGSETYDNQYNPAEAMYKSYANILLPTTQEKFLFADGGSGSSDCFFINFKRNKFKEKLDSGNWELRLGSGSYEVRLIDNSTAGDGSGPTSHPSVETAYYIVSGSGTTMLSTATAHPYGIFYPNLGIMVLNAEEIAADLGAWDYSGSQDRTSEINLDFYQRFVDGDYFAARNEEEITSINYFCRVYNDQYNFSNNPTWQTGSNGVMKYSEMYKDPVTYITTIGLYDDDNNLLAVAKLNKPQKKTFERELSVKVRLDF